MAANRIVKWNRNPVRRALPNTTARVKSVITDIHDVFRSQFGGVSVSGLAVDVMTGWFDMLGQFNFVRAFPYTPPRCLSGGLEFAVRISANSHFLYEAHELWKVAHTEARRRSRDVPVSPYMLRAQETLEVTVHCDEVVPFARWIPPVLESRAKVLPFPDPPLPMHTRDASQHRNIYSRRGWRAYMREKILVEGK